MELKHNGILLVDKPPGPTSHDIVEIARHALNTRQVGHMGTLDPLADGLLVLGVGEGTKLTPFLSDLDKTYECVARLGARSSTYDAMGTIEPVDEPTGLDVAQIEQELGGFRGTIEQLPPAFSAVKLKGRPLYKYARAGEEAERRPRRVRVYELAMLRWESPELELHLRVSSGTYVRSIVHDLGERLGVGAYVQRLRRTHVGPFSVDQALAIAPNGSIPADWQKGWRSMAEAMRHWTAFRVPEALLAAVRNGTAVAAAGLESPSRAAPRHDDLYVLLDSGDRLVAVARCLVSRGDLAVQGGSGGRGELVLKPVRVFHDE